MGSIQVREPQLRSHRLCLMNSALLGSTGILEAIKKNAPAVKKVVITSSMSAVVPLTGSIVGKKYSGVNIRFP